MSLWTRFRPLIQLRSLPLWGAIVWGWAVLAQVHLALFAADVFAGIDAFAHRHPTQLVLLGLGGLVILVLWPSIAKHFAWLKFTTVHRRLDLIEGDHIPSLKKDCGDLTGRLEKTELLAKTTAGMQAITEMTASGLETKVGSLDSRVAQEIVGITLRITDLVSELRDRELPGVPLKVAAPA